MPKRGFSQWPSMISQYPNGTCWSEHPVLRLCPPPFASGNVRAASGAAARTAISVAMRKAAIGVAFFVIT